MASTKPGGHVHILESTMKCLPSSAHPSRHPHVLPDGYDDQVALLYSRVEELKQLFKQFVDGHNEMKAFRDLVAPLGRLAVSPNVVRVTLDDFCTAVKCGLSHSVSSTHILRHFIDRNIKPQVTEIFERHRPKSPAPSVLSHSVNGEPSNAFPELLHYKTVDLNHIKPPLDGTKAFELRVTDEGRSHYPITIKWHPTAPTPDTDAIPAGLKFDINPDGRIVRSDLPPLVDAPRTSVDRDVTHWRDSVSTIHSPKTTALSKGKKRAREEDVEDGAYIPQRKSRHARITKNPELDAQGDLRPDIPRPVRRSARLKAGDRNKIAIAKGKTKATEEGNSSAGGPKARRRLRMPVKRI